MLRLSEDRLPPAEREAWRKLGVFTSSFEATAGQVIAGADEPMLARFVRCSLLEREGADRYRLHDLAADYTRARLSEPALDNLHMTHTGYFLRVGVESQRLYLEGDVVGGLALFDRERAANVSAFQACAFLKSQSEGSHPGLATFAPLVLADSTVGSTFTQIHRNRDPPPAR